MKAIGKGVRMKNIEKELKYELLKEDYIKFKSYLSEHGIKMINCCNQSNYYIDTNSFDFIRMFTSVRIRKIVGEPCCYEFTIKTPSSEEKEGNIKIKNEYTINLPEKVAEEVINNNCFVNHEAIFNELFNEANILMDLMELKIIGELCTRREFYLIDERYEPLNIDISTYFGKEDYEIEWETENAEKAEETILKIFGENDIKFLEKSTSKIGRFFNLYQQNKLD